MKNNRKAKILAGALSVVQLLTPVAAASVLIACEETKPEEKPVAQSKILDITTRGGTINVTVNYMAVPGSIPGYMPTLELVTRNVLAGMITSSDLTINVVDGNGSFVLAGAKTLSVGESWISKATETEMGMSMDSVRSAWVAMIQPTHDNGWKQRDALG